MRTEFYEFVRDVSTEEGGKEYHELAQCIRSGQVSYDQIQEHMKDEDFKEYYLNNFYDYGIIPQ